MDRVNLIIAEYWRDSSLRTMKNLVSTCTLQSITPISLTWLNDRTSNTWKVFPAKPRRNVTTSADSQRDTENLLSDQ